MPGQHRPHRLPACRTPVIALSETAPVNPLAIGYLNRLSDYLFDLGRHLNHLSSTPEQSWQP